MNDTTPMGTDADRSYRKKLLRLLSTATFFEGYDNYVLSFVLAGTLASLGGTEAQAGGLRAIVSVGTVLSFALAAQADRLGRKRLLLITIAGYTIATVATAAAPNLAVIAITQGIAQIFIGAEWAVAVTMVVEEFPTGERGRSLGIVTSMQTFGAIAVGLLGFAGLGDTELGWRAYYLVGIIPLVLVANGRRSLRDSERHAAVRADERLDHVSIWEPWKPAFRRLLVPIGLAQLLRFTAVSAAAFWWAFYAQRETGMSEATSGLFLAVSGLVGAVGFFVAGRLMDRFGRVPLFITYMGGALVTGVATFNIAEHLLMLPFFCLSIFFGLGSVAITSAMATEPFPTYVRSRASAWNRNAVEVVGGIIGAWVVGVLGDDATGALGSIGAAMTALLLVTVPPAMFIAWRFIPETRGRDIAAHDEEHAASLA
ncbi:MAG: MFS transporter [Actinomycetota bacterium]